MGPGFHAPSRSAFSSVSTGLLGTRMVQRAAAWACQSRERWSSCRGAGCLSRANRGAVARFGCDYLCGSQPYPRGWAETTPADHRDYPAVWETEPTAYPESEHVAYTQPISAPFLGRQRQ